MPGIDVMKIHGYRRADGQFGIRNHVLILGINGLAVRAAERIAANILGAVLAATHAGRGQIEPDLSFHLNELTGLAKNPNVAAVLIVGVDRMSADMIAASVATTGKPCDVVTFAEAEEDMLTVLDLGIRRAARLALLASGSPREEAPLSDLIVGIECGHSDSSSGVAANPVVGAAVDLLVDHGAAVILGETIEWLGAEHLLAKRAKTPELSKAIIDAVTAREQWARASGKSLTGNNPGEENIRGGLSTIEEKSLGAIAKSGSRSIESLIAVGERPSGPGLHVMDGPSFSPESLTGFAAAGAQVMLFTTGPGNSFTSAIAPTLKVTAQPATATRLREQIDFDAGNAFLGVESTEEAGARLVGALIEVCNGKLTWGEVLKEGLEVPTRILGSL